MYKKKSDKKGTGVNKPVESKLHLCINRIDKYLDNEQNDWTNIYNELYAMNKEASEKKYQ